MDNIQSVKTVLEKVVFFGNEDKGWLDLFYDLNIYQHPSKPKLEAHKQLDRVHTTQYNNPDTKPYFPGVIGERREPHSMGALSNIANSCKKSKSAVFAPIA